MTSPLRPADRLLLAGQATGAVALAVAWTLFPQTGWPKAGLGLLCAGAILAGWAFRSLGPAFRAAPTPRPEATLVRSGVYRWVRHPMYIGATIAVVGATVSRPSWPVIVVALVNCAWYLLKANFEEGRLLARYPDYDEYRRRTLGLPFPRHASPRRKP